MWYHANCGGAMEIGSKANYHCSKCDFKSHVRNWRYKCPSHGPSFGNEEEFMPTSAPVLAQAIGQALELLGKAGLDFVQEFLIHLESNEW